jgi:hypothetical protein
MVRGIGDNGGPPLDPEESWRHWCWKRAHKRAWKTPPREIALRRLANAEALGMTYREYTLEIMERGRHPDRPPVREAPQVQADARPERMLYRRRPRMRRYG